MRDQDRKASEFLDDLLQRRAQELYTIPDALMDADGMIECLAIPIRDVVIFPNMVMPLVINTPESVCALENAQDRSQTVIGLFPPSEEEAFSAPEQYFSIGVELAVGRILEMQHGGNSVLAQGRRRLEIVAFTQIKPCLRVQARVIPEEVEVTRETNALMRTVRELFEHCVELDHTLSEEAYYFAMSIQEPGWLADMVVNAIAPDLSQRMQLLAMADPLERLDLVSRLLAQEVDVLELEDQIHDRVQNEVDRSQREIYLREQMKAIQTELGEGDLWALELAELRNRIDAAALPDDTRARALKELQHLSQIPPMSPEVGIIRAYIDWILELPWQQDTPDNLDVRHAAQVLEEGHYGLKKAKERILEYIAVRSLKPKHSHQPILCFVGPPGTGKTSLGKSIAQALGRKFVRLSLGGVRDEAEIRGHRRTYIGALPGRILQTMRRAEAVNPVFMLDEIDKVGSDYRGDPSAALLEVLDPEQNNAFSDHYLEMPYDLSRVMFITTANSTEDIPSALLDRMEVIRFSGYIEQEKLEIAKTFLVPRQVSENGLAGDRLTFSETTLKKIVREYTYEAGVRNLEREIGKICRKMARLKAEGQERPLRVGTAMLERFLGPPKNLGLMPDEEDSVGVAMGLAWTENGGEIMPVEVALVDGKGNLQMTGQLGDVMQESVQAALTYLKSRAQGWRLNPAMFEQTDVHIHFPEGGIPKDGPSAGITVAVALVSAFTGRKVRHEVGMTGEITLRGRVLPIGGVRDKVLAAHRVGLTTVILPKKNLKDLEELPLQVKQDLRLIPVEHLDQVLKSALRPGRGSPWRPRSLQQEKED